MYIGSCTQIVLLICNLNTVLSILATQLKSRKYEIYSVVLQVKVSSLVSSTLVHDVLKAPGGGISPEINAVLLCNHERLGVRGVDFFRVSTERRAPRNVGG